MPAEQLLELCPPYRQLLFEEMESGLRNASAQCPAPAGGGHHHGAAPCAGAQAVRRFEARPAAGPRVQVFVDNTQAPSKSKCCCAASWTWPWPRVQVTHPDLVVRPVITRRTRAGVRRRAIPFAQNEAALTAADLQGQAVRAAGAGSGTREHAGGLAGKAGHWYRQEVGMPQLQCHHQRR